MDQPTATGGTTEARERNDLESLGPSVLANLVGGTLLAIAVLDGDRRCLFANPAACRILVRPAEELVGRPWPFGPLPAAPEGEEAGEFRTAFADLETGDGRRIAVEYAEDAFGEGDDARIAVFFRDVTAAQQQERRLAAFARTASSLAYAQSLQQLLDAVAAEVLPPTGAVACAVMLIDHETRVFRMAGTAGHLPDYLDRMERCRRLGAPLATLAAFVRRQPEVRSDVQLLVDDPRYAPIREVIAAAAWRSVAVVPLVARDEVLGVLSAFYPPDHDPTEADIAFLTAMSDQVAVAVDNVGLLRDLEGKAALEERHRLARELHDSVSQALFSMNLHARAVEMAIQDGGAEPDGRVARGIAELRELIQGALAEMRALIFQLRPEALHEEGLSAAIRKHAAAIAAREGLDVHVEAGEDRLALDEVAEEELFRVVQEAVHNCVKHAHPGHVDIRLAERSEDPGTLVVEVVDDGVGFEPAAPHPGHLGLESMRERTERLGGQLLVESSSAGSRVRAVLPGILREDGTGHR